MAPPFVQLFPYENLVAASEEIEFLFQESDIMNVRYQEYCAI